MVRKILLLSTLGIFLSAVAWAQCGGNMEPGFAFLTSSRGCAPFTVQIETLYLNAVPGTLYYVDWGDGSAEETYTQVNPTGVIIQHTYPNISVDCGYDVTIDASNACNPRGSVVPIETQVIVWTNDVASIGPSVYRVCQGFATDLQFTDNSDWNCFPRATRENSEPRWIQWIYGTGVAGSRIPGVKVDGISPGTFPYLDPDPNANPLYPVMAPGQMTLSLSVPVTTPADIGKQFEVTLKNWNQCNPYDNDLTDGNPRNPVGGDLVNGDNPPQTATAKIIIVASPSPDYATRLGGPGGPLQTTFCVNDLIYFQDQTPSIGGASFRYTWEFFDNDTGAGSPLATSHQQNPTFNYPTSGQKLVRLHVSDANAVGSCENTIDKTILISPSLIAAIQTTDLSDVPLVPDFCQEPVPPLNNFSVRFHDVSAGTISPDTQWRWEFYDQSGNLVQQEPSGGGYSTIQLGPFDESYDTPGIYHVKLFVRDNATACETVADARVRVFNKPQPEFDFSEECEGTPIHFVDASTLNPIDGDAISLREWDMNYDGSAFSPDPSLNNQTDFTHLLPAGVTAVALRTTTDGASCSNLIVHSVNVNYQPNASFAADQVSGCSVLTVNLTNTSISGQPDSISEYKWEVDAHDGKGFMVDSTQGPTASTYTKEFINRSSANKVFDIRLRAVTVNGCENLSGVTSITVLPGPGAGFVSSNYDPFADNCSPVQVHFDVDSATRALNPSDYTWEITKDTVVIDEESTGTIPSFDYAFVNNDQVIDNFNVALKVTLPSGCYGDSTRIVRVSPVPLSDFAIDTLDFNCDQMKIRAEASQKGLVSYDWIIRINGVIVNTKSGPDDFIEYTVPRSADDQSVQLDLTTVNFAGCSSENAGQDLIVAKKDNINASFDVTPTHLTLPSSTVLISNNTNDGLWQFNWDFGDGTTSDTRDVTQHTYQNFGTYTISLKVSDGMCEKEADATIVIDPIPPIVDFDYNPASGCAPLTVTFTNKSQYADPTSYFWSFGENQGSSRATNPKYTYFEPGRYSVTLEATNITGDTARLTRPLIIDVIEVPVSRFDIKPSILSLPGTLYTRNESTGATSYAWDFGDGGTSSQFEPTHEYTTEGTYTVTLAAMNPSGCADTARLDAGVRVVNSGEILVPNAFTPNLSGPGATASSGVNDVFIPMLRGVTSFHMQVFDRWGELLFETSSPTQGWDGYYHGKLCAQDVYVYKITATYENGNTITRMGDINLIR